jgi:hypothetical protein
MADAEEPIARAIVPIEEAWLNAKIYSVIFGYSKNFGWFF